ncbi:MAG: fumarylacetoacetate hydrolase family protein [Planctomycetota bacterium]
MILTRCLGPDGRPCFVRDRGDGTGELWAGSPVAGAATPTGEAVAVGRRLAPVEPVNVFCIGLNYRAHAAEMGVEPPTHPAVFMKPTTAVVGPGEAVLLPRAKRDPADGPEVDAEAELAVVMGLGPDGRPARDVAEADALDYVLGYTAANDVSARRWQKHGGGGQWVRGKSFDTFCPLGPVLVTARPVADADADVIDDPQALTLVGTVNGEIRQSTPTADMIFSVAELVAFLSRDTTLLPGTVVLTGTPSGVGMGMTPPRFLADGDTVGVKVSGVGRLENPVRAGS